MTGWQTLAAVGWCLAIAAIAFLILALGCIEDINNQLKRERARRTTARVSELIRYPEESRDA